MIADPAAILRQTYREVLPNRFDTRPANVLLIAIGLQESRFVHRTQIGGPARGFWQFERGGGVRGVLMHRSTDLYAESVCLLRRVQAGAEPVYQKLATDDVLACAFARLLLWTDPRPVPTEVDQCWLYYLSIWRPFGWEEGFRHRHYHTWKPLYAQAEAMCPSPST